MQGKNKNDLIQHLSDLHYICFSELEVSERNIANLEFLKMPEDKFMGYLGLGFGTAITLAGIIVALLANLLLGAVGTVTGLGMLKFGFDNLKGSTEEPEA